MTTLRESIQADLEAAISSRDTKIQAALATATQTVDAEIEAIRAKLAQVDGAFAALLEKDKDEVRAWFHSVGQHLGL